MTDQLQELIKLSHTTYIEERKIWKECPGPDLKSKEYLTWRPRWLKAKAEHSSARASLAMLINALTYGTGYLADWYNPKYLPKELDPNYENTENTETI